jgi:cytochrome c-type biogenesis protein CcmH
MLLRARRIAAVALVLLVAFPVAAGAWTVNDVARQVRCPTCNTPLDVSNAPVALDMKKYIAEKRDAGWTQDQVIDGLVEEFGRGVLATPPKSGFDLVAWVVPGVVVLIGLASIPLLTRAWARRRGPDAAATGPPPTPEEARRLEEELRRLR